MRVDPKALVKRLTPTATRYLELAAGKAVSAQHYEIDVEHMLLGMLSDAEGECVRCCRQLRYNPGPALAELERAIGRMRAGNPKRPAIAENLLTWFEDAWLTASVELGEIRLRSGALLYQLLVRPARYAEDSVEELSQIEAATWKAALLQVGASSEEGLAAQPSWEAGGARPSGIGGGAAPVSADSALGRFTQDFTQAAREGKIDPVFGRHREIRQVIDILSRRRKNNPIIVGEPGVGKTALVEGLALAIVEADVPEHLRNVRLLSLDMGALSAGASVKGEFENRLKAVISEVKSSPTPCIVFIDEAHTLIGAGGPQGGGDAANLLKPALARGELRTIAATTWAEYKKYFEKDAALERRFQMVKVDEPAEQDAVVMMRGLRAVYEKAHDVVIREDAIVAAVELSHRYLTGRQLPDKAVDLLDTTAARVRVERAAKPEELVGLTLSLASLERKHSALERDARDGDESARDALEETLEEIERVRAEQTVLQEQWQKEMTALEAVLAARRAVEEAATAGAEPDALGKLRAKAKECSDELSRIGGENRLVHVDVDADAVGRTVSAWTGIPVGRVKRDAQQAVLGLEATLKGRVIGQDHAMQTLSEIIRIAQAGIREPNAPLGVLLFVGPSGVGKTETALALADELYGGERSMTTINMSEFQEKHSVSRLIGSPPGYVGYGEGGVLTEAVRQRPYSVVLLDECEKADLEVMNLFYQVFDKGSLTDGEGRTIDFRNTLIILTSNLASDLVMRSFADGKRPSAEEVAATIRPTLSRHFQPALLARMSIVPYAPIGSDAMGKIASLKLAKIARRVEDTHGLRTRFDPTLVATVAQRCTEAETGARNIDHILRGSLMPALASALLARMGELDGLEGLDVGLDAQGEWTFAFG
jgi:type VI secretion system protein VasG